MNLSKYYICIRSMREDSTHIIIYEDVVECVDFTEAYQIAREQLEDSFCDITEISLRA